MTRRLVRASVNLGVLLVVILTLIFFLDNRYRVLPNSIHSHLPLHHPGLVITDLTIKTCNKANPLSSCRLDPDEWHRIEKDLYLGSSWTKQAFVHIRSAREEELGLKDMVVMDVRVGRLDPSVGEKGQENQKWESRPGGVWIKLSSKRHDSDSKKAVTAVEVLFGADAADPRPSWELKPPLLLDMSLEAATPRLTVQRGSTPRTIEKPTPRVRRDGRFKIMQVADIHFSTGMGACRDPEPPEPHGGRCEADPRTLEFLGKMLDTEKPDLVILSGDQVNGETAPDAQTAILKFADIFIQRQIPFATIFGNHDDFEKSSLSRQAQMSLIHALPFSLSEAGPATVSGVGNYYVEVLAPGTSTHSALTIYLLDSHGHSGNEGYDYIKEDQIKWFKATSRALKDQHKKYTHIHLDMAFIHIPLPEYREVGKPVQGSVTAGGDDQNNGQVVFGDWKEPVMAPNKNTGFRDALLEEGISVLSVGHDHANSFCGISSKPNGEEPTSSHDQRTMSKNMWLCYGGGAGLGGYGGYGGYRRRVRFFELDANDGGISTWSRLEHGDRGKFEDHVLVEGGQVVV
ncbi:Metallo-dependent phosphatase [Eremomyces bilateralis CBS 781.70]|uniref:Metallo-dependent phosphatase n=1 Tax=Eremomyces bilateralis CBS 781.70 TaxID=1392243 RepID=A0A6G1GBD2_9PEZI|nr:Metallo-dependent phosphatase [Eremomyces bilateralis CBS 781.70]KAF1815385.1 Metallo-dependent phosphatase [Eremomyces bilateralis CBS 781.70]